MVCAKCQRLTKSTELATPSVKRKNELYYGSPATASSKAADKSKTSATLGNNGVGKVSAGHTQTTACYGATGKMELTGFGY